MDGRTAIAKILKAEGTEFVSCFPMNPVLEAVALENIRIITARTERVAVGISDGYTRASFGKRIGVSMVQSGPGSENSFAAVAQAFADSVPILFMPGAPVRRDQRRPSFSAIDNYQSISKWAVRAQFADQIPTLMRRAYTVLKSGRPGPVVLEIPSDVMMEKFDDSLFQYKPVKGWKSGGDPGDISRVAKKLIGAKRPIIRAGNGILYAQAWKELVQFAELYEIPVFTTMQGKSGFPENHPLSLGTGGRTRTKMVSDYLREADLIFAIGSSCTNEVFTTNLPKGCRLIQSTIDEVDIGKDYPVEEAIIGDAKLVLQQLIDEVGSAGKPEKKGVADKLRADREEWLAKWQPKLTSKEIPINPYRLMAELNDVLEKRKSVVTPESGGPRDQSMPFYQATAPGGFIGWGKTTTLGGSLGFAMGAKLANPDKIAVNILGDAGIGMAGFDFETSVRENIPILSIMINNGEFGGYAKMHPIAAERYNIIRVGGDYTTVLKGFGFQTEKITEPEKIAPALKRAVATVTAGQSVFLEFMTRIDTEFSL